MSLTNGCTIPSGIENIEMIDSQYHIIIEKKKKSMKDLLEVYK